MRREVIMIVRGIENSVDLKSFCNKFLTADIKVISSNKNEIIFTFENEHDIYGNDSRELSIYPNTYRYAYSSKSVTFPGNRFYENEHIPYRVLDSFDGKSILYINLCNTTAQSNFNASKDIDKKLESLPSFFMNIVLLIEYSFIWILSFLTRAISKK